MINIYKEYKDFLIIGLTGRTGSGCSTAAKILASGNFNLPDAADTHYTGNELRKFKIIKKFINKQSDELVFEHLQIRNVITSYLLSLGFEGFCALYSSILKREVTNVNDELSDIKNAFNEIERINTMVKGYKSTCTNETDLLNAYNYYTKELPAFSEKLKNKINNIEQGSYIRLYQSAGDNIRASNNASSNKFNAKHVLSLPEEINKAIKLIRSHLKKKNKPCYIVIDAIRNPYEAIFFKNRYSNFFLVSINTNNENRLKHLHENLNFSSEQIDELDKKEYPEKLTGYLKYTSQNIQKCIEISDIHINNPKKDKYGDNDLRCQLAWYVSLMLHPGMVMPTATETCMQIAYSAKMNSGCISRQVGAAITNASYSIKAVGWNNTPEGQVPCLLRSAEDLLAGIDVNAYSLYERNDSIFRNALKIKFSHKISSKNIDGRNISYCFKDIRNEIKSEKNQVHTRSLHAEENAFLQITKYGGQSIKDGFLFTTASPCELCAKKAYQLGISKIIYIDPYPGIATEHIIQCGHHQPKLELFRGAIGRAFHRLYQPTMPFKDELEIVLGINPYKKKSSIEEIEKRIEELKKELEIAKAST
ncbi:hypothetical protein GO977_08850 [Aeromonas veronii]|nr:hypothetical protein GO977_08850 [Aeromonas veronii]